MGNGRDESIAYLLGMLTIPAIGLALLIVGLVLRAKQNRTNPIGGVPPQWPPYPQPGFRPPGQPPQANYPWPGQHPAAYPPAPPRRSNTPTVLIVVGAVILALSILGVLGRAGQAVQDQRHASPGAYNAATSAQLDAAPRPAVA